MKTFKPLYRLKKYFIIYKRDIILGFVLIIFANSLYAILPKILQFIVDKIEQGIESRELFNYSLLLIAITATHAVIRCVMRRTIAGMARKIEYHLRNDYFSHLQQLSLSFFEKHRTGDLMARATNDIRSVSMTVGRGYMFFFSNLIIFIVVISLMISTNLKLTLLALLPFPFVIFVVYKSMKFFFKTFERIQALFSDITSKAQENIAGVRVIKAYVQEENEISNFNELNKRYLRENMRLAKGRGLVWSSMEMFFGFSFIILLWIGGYAVINEQISIGDFVAFTVWLGMLSWPIISFGWIINLVQRASASMKRINKIMDETPDIRDTEFCDKSIKKIHGGIEFRNVSFSYGDPLVLKDISFKVNPGQILAIIGPTGSGKTTLINLVPRLIDVSDGIVYIDGQDIRAIPLKVLRKNIGYVQQETFLFSETIEENISFGVKNPDPKEIRWAAQVSTIKKDLVSFPDQFQTLIGERGVNLSGGQKQRTAISRALLRKPKILILDDALSSVDTYTEEIILNSLKEQDEQQTKIIISHRISSVKHADMILVMQNGEISERGTHEELLKKNGFYADLYEQQLLEQALEEL